MVDLLVAGNLYFSVPLVIVAAAVLAVTVRAAVLIARGADAGAETRMLFHLGLFAFVFGLLSQTISLYQMMGAIQQAGGVSPAILAGGLQVSFIVPIFGVLIFAVVLLLRFGLDVWFDRAATLAQSG